MANQYKSFYLGDILATIDRVAIESMLTPVFEHKKPDGIVASLAEVSNYNSLVAANNAGVRDLCIRLKDALTEEGEEKDD